MGSYGGLASTLREISRLSGLLSAILLKETGYYFRKNYKISSLLWPRCSCLNLYGGLWAESSLEKSLLALALELDLLCRWWSYGARNSCLLLFCFFIRLIIFAMKFLFSCRLVWRVCSSLGVTLLLFRGTFGILIDWWLRLVFCPFFSRGGFYSSSWWVEANKLSELSDCPLCFGGGLLEITLNLTLGVFYTGYGCFGGPKDKGFLNDSYN